MTKTHPEIANRALIRMHPDAHPFGLPVYVAPLPAGSIH